MNKMQMNRTVWTSINRLYSLWVYMLLHAQSLFLLVIRAYWGFGFFQAGLGKFQNWDRTVGFFTELGLPYPQLNVAMASGTELVGGLLLLIGLGGRLVPIPLIGTMCVAYLTAHQKELLGIFADPDAFFAAPPFLFLYAAVIILLFGPGRWSADALIGSRVQKFINADR